MTSIRAHLIGRLLIISALLFGAADIIIWLTLDRVLDANRDGSLLAKARARSSLVAQTAQGIDIDWRNLKDPISYRDEDNGPPDILQVQDINHKVLGGDSSLALIPPTLKSNVAYWEAELPNGNVYRVVALKFQPHRDEDQEALLGNKKVPPCLMIVATDRNSLDPDYWMALILAGVTFAALLASAGIIFREVKKGLAPLQEFSTKVSDIDETSLGQRFNVNTLPAEISPIASKLNDLLGRMEISFARERRFSADVSHELRTPIAEMRTTSEIMLRQPDLSAEAKQSFSDLLDASRQMESLVAALLELVRGDRHRTSLDLSILDFSHLIRQAWKPYKAKAFHKELKVAFDAPDISISCDEQLLRSILNNLYSNAVEYTPPGGIIDLSLKNDAERCILSLCNTATQVSAEDLPRFFDQFWRKDKVRGTTGHLGLGLSLTKMLCDRLKIQIDVSLPKQNFVCFNLTIPRSGPTE